MKLSIITINYNNIEGLKKTMMSVFSQTIKDFEYIVIDGASTDGSAEYVKENADKLTYWLSENDTGIYNAMNKGVRAAHGDYVLMLNSGDFLVDEKVVEHVIPNLDGVDIIQGNILQYCDNSLKTATRNRGYGKTDVDWFDVIGGNFLHQASFCKVSLFNIYGYFDEHYKVISDAKFFMTCLGRGNASFKYIDLDISYYDTTGVSSDWSGRWFHIRQNEREKLDKELYSRRQLEFYANNQKKIRLYDNLHKHLWSWTILVIITRISNIIYDK